MNIIIPTPLSKYIHYSKDDVLINKKKLRETHSITINNVKFTDTELLKVAAKRNQIHCLTCGDTLRSIYPQHRVYCSCGKCSIDGGEFELKRDCTGPYIEETIYW